MLAVAHSAEPFIRIGASGVLTAEDYRGFETRFVDELGRRTTPVPLLLDMRGFRGWTPLGLLRDVLWDVRNRNTFSKIAVIGDARWHQWLTTAGTPLFRARPRYFRSGEEHLAEEWLCGV